jgi:hypothetical protein
VIVRDLLSCFATAVLPQQLQTLRSTGWPIRHAT